MLYCSCLPCQNTALQSKQPLFQAGWPNLNIKLKKNKFGTNSGKSEGVVWINLPLGGPKSNETFLRGTAPKESLITQGTSRGEILHTILEDFPIFSDFWIKTVKIMQPKVALGLTLNIFQFYLGEV